jgi:hypothetical protein
VFHTAPFRFSHVPPSPRQTGEFTLHVSVGACHRAVGDRATQKRAPGVLE